MRQNGWFRLCIGFAFALASAYLARSQSLDDVHIELRQPPGSERSSSLDAARTSQFRVDVDLVLVPVTVTDAMNRPVTSLQKQNFALYDGEKPQEIRYFFQEEAPLSVAVLLDISNSMSNKIDVERAALRDFLNNANPQDEYFAITFSDRPRVIASSTSSIDEMQQELLAAQPGGPTAMLDAIYLAEAQLRHAKYERRAIVIFSDGGDNASIYTHREITNLVREADVQVYAVGLFETSAFSTLEEKLGKKWLTDITDCTGGRTVTVQNRARVSEAAADISREIRSHMYSATHSTIPGNGKWRKIKVRILSSISKQPLRASYKTGYISHEK